MKCCRYEYIRYKLQSKISTNFVPKTSCFVEYGSDVQSCQMSHKKRIYCKLRPSCQTSSASAVFTVAVAVAFEMADDGGSGAIY